MVGRLTWLSIVVARFSEATVEVAVMVGIKIVDVVVIDGGERAG